jgi:uncharacterized protein
VTPDWGVVLGLTVCIAFGTYIQSTLGFGLNLLLTPFALLLLPGFVPVPALLVNGAVSLLVALRFRPSIDRQILCRAMLWSIPGTILGVLVLSIISGPTIGILGASVVLTAVATTAGGLSIPLHPNSIAAAGGFSGFLATTTSLTGPPLSVALHRADPHTRRATIGASGVLLTITSLASVALLHPTLISETITATLLALPGVVAGLLLAHLAPDVIPHCHQRPTALLVAAIAATVLLIKSIATA